MNIKQILLCCKQEYNLMIIRKFHKSWQLCCLRCPNLCMTVHKQFNYNQTMYLLDWIWEPKIIAEISPLNHRLKIDELPMWDIRILMQFFQLIHMHFTTCEQKTNVLLIKCLHREKILLVKKSGIYKHDTIKVRISTLYHLSLKEASMLCHEEQDVKDAGSRFHVKTVFRYGDSHDKYKMVLMPSYLLNRDTYR